MNLKPILLLFAYILINVKSILADPQISQFLLYGRGQFGDVYNTEDNGYALSGCDNRYSWIIKTDPDGGVQWHNTHDVFNDHDSESLITVIEATGGDLIAGGGSGKFFGCRFNGANGNLIWERQYGGEGGYWCRSVIETKAGQFILAGSRFVGETLKGYLIFIDGDGNVLHDATFEPDICYQIMTVLESPDNGFYLAGENRVNGYSATLLHYSGEELLDHWTYRVQGAYSGFNSMVSVQGGFVMCGSNLYTVSQEKKVRITRVNHEGQAQWDSEYQIENLFTVNSLARFPDQGVAVVGETGQGTGFVFRTDQGGNLKWIYYASAPLDGASSFHNCIVNRNGELMVIGFGGDQHGRAGEGLLLKFAYERYGPYFVWHSPDSLSFFALPNERLPFSVRAQDSHDDTICYTWKVNDSLASITQNLDTAFTDTGGYKVQCRAYNDGGADTLTWRVTVTNLFIRSFSPDSTNLTIQRDLSRNFSIVVAASEGEPVNYQWTLTDSVDGRDSVISDQSSTTYRFCQTGDYRLEALAYRGESSINVAWTIQVRSLVWSWWPRVLNLQALRDTTIQFGVLPFANEVDSVRYFWTINHHFLSDSSNAQITFMQEGQQTVIASISAPNKMESVVWHISVSRPNSLSSFILHPSSFTLYPPSPNPFNNSTAITFSLPRPGYVSVKVFDIRGAIAANICRGWQPAGDRRVIWNATGLPTGEYFIRLEAPGGFVTRKALLIK